MMRHLKDVSFAQSLRQAQILILESVHPERRFNKWALIRGEIVVGESMNDKISRDQMEMDKSDYFGGGNRRIF
jgi:hypothetical protein